MIDSNLLRGRLEALLAGVPAASAGVEYELTGEQKISRNVGWADGKPSLRNASQTEGLCIRLLRDGGQALLTTSQMDAGHVKTLMAHAADIARHSPKDAHRKLADKAASYPADVPADDSIFKQSPDDILDMFSAMDKKILTRDKRLKKIVKFNFAEEDKAFSCANSRGVSIGARSTSAVFVVEILAEEGGQSEVSWEFRTARRAGALPVEAVADAVAEHALQSLGGRSLPSGAYAVVVPPRVGTQLLSLMSDALSAEAVQLNRSFLAGRLNQEVASPLVNISDDALLPDGVASIPFDDEGTPHKKLSIIENGRLASYIYDLRSASRDGVASTGHGIKENLMSPPSPHPTNFFMHPAASTPQDLLGSSEKIFLLQDVMGLHMADPISGEFSLGASGALYEKGRFSRAVRGVTIAGNLKDILRGVSGVANDLTWYGSIGSPTFLLSRLAVSGE